MFRRHCSSVANYGDAKAESPLSAARAFILGPGRAPISAKVVTQIVSHKFIDMVELVPENLEELRPVTPSFSIEGSTIIPSSKTNPRKVKEISDIMTWVEAFTSYISVMSAYFPHIEHAICWPTWPSSCEPRSVMAGLHGVITIEACDIRDWSAMKPDLYNYYTTSLTCSSGFCKIILA